MAVIHIPDEIDHSVQRLAERLGVAKDDFVRDAVTQRLAEYDEEPELTEAQIARMRESIAQLDRGEGIPGEVVMAKLQAWIDKAEGR